jgi:endonuclease/exonuclease/phosphatase family metal-dependent hydrolase
MDVLDADVWVLTETRRDLAPGPEFRLVAHSEKAPDRTEGEVWVAIWTRLDPARPVATADSERTACMQLVAESGGSLLVFGTVLPWLTDRRRDPLRGFAAFDAALQEQKADWQKLKRANPHDLVCVAGDFNQDLLEEGHYYGSTRGRAALRTALEAAGLTCMTAGTRDPVAAQWPGYACIDHICISNEFMPTVGSVHSWPSNAELGSRLTDHFGVAVSLNTSS